MAKKTQIIDLIMKRPHQTIDSMEKKNWKYSINGWKGSNHQYTIKKKTKTKIIDQMTETVVKKNLLVERPHIIYPTKEKVWIIHPSSGRT